MLNFDKKFFLFLKHIIKYLASKNHYVETSNKIYFDINNIINVRFLHFLISNIKTFIQKFKIYLLFSNLI